MVAAVDVAEAAGIDMREILETLQQLLMGALRGLGKTVTLFRIQTITTCLVWLPVLFAIRACHPTLAAYWLSMLAYMLTAVILLTFELRKTNRGI